MNLLSHLEDSIGPSQLSVWINGSASLGTKDYSVKTSDKVTTNQNQTDNTIQGNTSTEITPYHAKAKCISRICSKCNQKTQDSTKLKEYPVVHFLIDNEQTGKW